MPNRLPYKIDPFRSAAHKMQLQGNFMLGDMQRLVPSLHSTEGEVTVDADFAMDEQDICVLKGQLKTSLTLQCQRCMEPFKYDIIDEFLSGIVQTEDEAEKLPEQYDPVIAIEGELALLDMIEDEIIIALPIVPMHDANKCKVKLPLEAGTTESNNPFNVISILRSKDDLKSKE